MQPLLNSAPDTSAMRVRYDQSTDIVHTPHRLSPGHYLTPQNMPLIYVPIYAGLFRSTPMVSPPPIFATPFLVLSGLLGKSSGCVKRRPDDAKRLLRPSMRTSKAD